MQQLRYGFLLVEFTVVTSIVLSMLITIFVTIHQLTQIQRELKNQQIAWSAADSLLEMLRDEPNTNARTAIYQQWLKRLNKKLSDAHVDYQCQQYRCEINIVWHDSNQQKVTLITWV